MNSPNLNAPNFETVVPPDLSHIKTEDDAPMDNVFSERQQRLLVETLYADWSPPEPFVALANVGLFHGVNAPPLVPDMLLSAGVALPQGGAVYEKRHRSYFVWEYQKPPDLVVEIISNKEGEEFGEKRRKYASLGVGYYVIFDPESHYGSAKLTCLKLEGRTYAPIDCVFADIGLKATLWEGAYQGMTNLWLRWQTSDGRLIRSAEERIADEIARANAERERAEKLAAKLRALGVNPDEL